MKNMKFYGVGGQGVVTATKVMSSAVSLYEDKYAITVPAYGHERRGAPVYSDIIMDDKPITLNCFVYHPDVVIVMDETVVDKNVNIGAGCAEHTILVLNTGSREKAESLACQFGFKEVYYADATHIAVEYIGRNIPNGPILGVLAKTGIVSIESIETALIDFFGEKAGEKNAKSARAAYEKTAKM
ncbi:MAG: 2-oxoacid:acceptor oxidoreductase family protein [Ruminococcus sp.]|nr:2-oxoacid:acceptor oxidoreductase family protein [Ruminococcus sp.]